MTLRQKQTCRTDVATNLTLLAAVLVVCVSLGCVQRRMMIRTNPPGAVVYIDDYEIGTTPTATNFTYYGTRKIRLVKDGYETLTVNQWVPPPWYQIFPLDFISENLVPGEIRDTRTLAYQLRPQMVVPTEQLLSRAENLRSRQPQPSPAIPVSATGGPPQFNTPPVRPEVIPPPQIIPPAATPTYAPSPQ